MFIHPFNEDGSINRLINDIDKHQYLVIGLDFDNTVSDMFSGCIYSNVDFKQLLDLIRRCVKLNWKICLYTAECDVNRLAEKVNFLQDQEIPIYYINQSPLLKGTSKPFFNILVDDRAGLESSYNTLLSAVEYAESKNI